MPSNESEYGYKEYVIGHPYTSNKDMSLYFRSVSRSATVLKIQGFGTCAPKSGADRRLRGTRVGIPISFAPGFTFRN